MHVGVRTSVVRVRVVLINRFGVKQTFDELQVRMPVTDVRVHVRACARVPVFL